MNYLGGKRVQIPVQTDEWMRGDRYGMIVRVIALPNRPAVAKVKLDKSGDVRSYRLASIALV